MTVKLDIFFDVFMAIKVFDDQVEVHKMAVGVSINLVKVWVLDFFI